MPAARSTPRSILHNAGWNAAGTLFNIALALVLAPLLIQRLGVDQWGLLLLVWSLAGVLGLANFGFGEASLRFIAHHHARNDLAGVNRVLGATLTYYAAVCAFIVAILWLAAPTVVQWVKVPAGSAYPSEWLVCLAALLFSMSMLENSFRAVPMALQRYDISNQIGVAQAAARSVGLVLLALAHFGVVYLVAWELFVACAGLAVKVVVARRLVPGLRCLPGGSLAGIREIIGYSMYSFATHVFLTIWREGPRLLLGHRLGAASVAYVGTPDNIANRLHAVVVSAVDTLVPRFSAGQSEKNNQQLLMLATWAALSLGAVLYVPIALLMPDFLRLWISPAFARESGTVAGVLVLALIAPSAYAPTATLFRGIGEPAFVTAVMASAAVIVMAGSLLLMPQLGTMGVAWSYLLATVAWLGGVVHGWLRLYGPSAMLTLMRIAGPPLMVGAGLAVLHAPLRSWWGEPDWLGLFFIGGVLFGAGTFVLLAGDLLVGGVSPARLVLARLRRSRQPAERRQRLGSMREDTP
jgi:O-antigen/teichoic acid export membrane protein